MAISWKRTIINNDENEQTRQSIYESIPLVTKNFSSIVAGKTSSSASPANAPNDTLTTSDGLYFKNTYRQGYTYSQTVLASSATSVVFYASGSGKNLYIDTVSLGDVDIIKFALNENSTVYSSFIFDHTKKIDTDADVVLNWVNDKTVSANPNGNSTWLGTSDLSHHITSIKYDASSPGYYLSRARGYSQKRILQPIYFHGVKSHLYNIDGGNGSPSDFSEFIVDNHRFLCVGISFAVKID